MQNRTYDVLVVGAGPNGVKVANQLRHLDTLLIDKNGICSGLKNLPKDFLLASQSQHNLGIKLNKSEEHIVSVDELTSYFEGYNQIPFQLAQLINITGQDGNFAVKTSTGIIKAKKVILATGIMSNPKPVHYDDGTASRYITHEQLNNERILIIGGGDTAALAAIRYYRNNDVHWVFRSSLEAMQNKVFRLWKEQVSELLPHVHTYPQSSIDTLHNSSCTLNDGQKINFDKAFLLVGYEPDFTLLEHIGIGLNEKRVPEHNLQTCESNIPGIYLCGIMMKEAVVNGVVKTPFLLDSDFLSNAIAKDLQLKI